MAEGGRAVKRCELRRCQVRIDKDVADVLMAYSVEDGKVTQLTMRYDEFENHGNKSRNHIP